MYKSYSVIIKKANKKLKRNLISNEILYKYENQ